MVSLAVCYVADVVDTHVGADMFSDVVLAVVVGDVSVGVNVGVDVCVYVVECDVNVGVVWMLLSLTVSSMLSFVDGDDGVVVADVCVIVVGVVTVVDVGVGVCVVLVFTDVGVVGCSFDDIVVVVVGDVDVYVAVVVG